MIRVACMYTWKKTKHLISLKQQHWNGLRSLHGSQTLSCLSTFLHSCNLRCINCPNWFSFFVLTLSFKKKFYLSLDSRYIFHLGDGLDATRSCQHINTGKKGPQQFLCVPSFFVFPVPFPLFQQSQPSTQALHHTCKSCQWLPCEGREGLQCLCALVWKTYLFCKCFAQTKYINNPREILGVLLTHHNSTFDLFPRWSGMGTQWN